MAQSEAQTRLTKRQAKTIAQRRSDLLLRFHTRWQDWHSHEGHDPEIPSAVSLAVRRWMLLQAKAAVSDDGRHLLTESVWTHILQQSLYTPNHLHEMIADAEWTRVARALENRYHTVNEADWTLAPSTVAIGKFALAPRVLWKLIRG